MTDKEVTQLSDVFTGIFIGGIAFIVILVIGYYLREMVISFIQWIPEYIQKKIWLHKRNKHRKKCGLKPIK